MCKFYKTYCVFDIPFITEKKISQATCCDVTKSAGEWDFQFPNHKPILLIQFTLCIDVLYINVLRINVITDQS